MLHFISLWFIRADLSHFHLENNIVNMEVKRIVKSIKYFMEQSWKNMEAKIRHHFFLPMCCRRRVDQRYRKR